MFVEERRDDRIIVYINSLGDRTWVGVNYEERVNGEYELRGKLRAKINELTHSAVIEKNKSTTKEENYFAYCKCNTQFALSVKEFDVREIVDERESGGKFAIKEEKTDVNNSSKSMQEDGRIIVYVNSLGDRTWVGVNYEERVNGEYELRGKLRAKINELTHSAVIEKNKSTTKEENYLAYCKCNTQFALSVKEFDVREIVDERESGGKFAIKEEKTDANGPSVKKQEAAF